MFKTPEGAAVKPPARFQLIITILSERFFQSWHAKNGFCYLTVLRGRCFLEKYGLFHAQTATIHTKDRRTWKKA